MAPPDECSNRLFYNEYFLKARFDSLQNSRIEFHGTLVKILSEGIKKFNHGKYKESEADIDIVINSFAGFETNDLRNNEKKLLASALTKKAEITTKSLEWSNRPR